MKLRSLLFVPGDRPERFAKASASLADAIIIDLEDSVALDKKVSAREATAEYLSGDRPVPVFVRVNPQDSHLTHDDLASVLPFLPDGIVLPKAEGARSINWLRAEAAAVADNPDGEAPPILPIATETPGAVFDLGSLREVTPWLAGVSWGAEDLPAAVGAATSREPDGSYTAPYELVRSLTLFAAHAAGVAAIDTVFPNISDADALDGYVARAARDGFTGMLAIHPSQVAIINSAFTPSTQQLEHAQKVVDAFAANPGAGVLQLDGKMIDAPHLKAALSILARV
ncbi:CoA ester lyase [Sphingorhabdus sp. IMCC26285]|jgi:citrate lyase subunit beta/citryl-CoA lyase|uniref:CoA ester lyase n=1 Tax=Sphingorhabdus profundilacus TaxID=2509718 RepID=A0A6I4LUU1_9SPHN|nr:CoA ester lyase [Sphingorhabdus profundilacus]MVZ97132.1 CoA ester lyase [Sphingorhabdus profundilacus]